MEILRQKAEQLSDGYVCHGASEAWGLVSSGARNAFDGSDVRAASAASRRDRSLSDGGEDILGAGSKAAQAAASFSAILGPESAKTLFAHETAARFRAEEGDPEGARADLAGVAEASAAVLCRDSLQALSARRSPALTVYDWPDPESAESLREDLSDVR
jgi:hypothetical protein